MTPFFLSQGLTRLFVPGLSNRMSNRVQEVLKMVITSSFEHLTSENHYVLLSRSPELASVPESFLVFPSII